MATTQVQRLHPLSEFTSASSNPNAAIFATEVGALALSAQPDSVARVASAVVLTWGNALPTAADLALIDAAVAAHAGGSFGSTLQYDVQESEATNDTTTESVRATIETGPLPAGDYQVVWSAEIAVASVVAGTGAQVLFYVTKNGGTRTQRGQGINDQAQFDTRGAVAYLTGVVDGDEFEFELAFKKLGASANTAKIQSARLYLKPLEL